jgi:hypothetical protein
MKNSLRLLAIVIAAAVALVICQSASHAKDKGTGHSKHETSYTTGTTSTPPGWSKGQKTGWHGEKYPPGWTKWDEKKRTKWRTDRDEAVTEIGHVCVRYRVPETKRNEITEAFNEAIAGGLVVNDARNKLVTALENKEHRKELMIDTSQSVLELLK